MCPHPGRRRTWASPLCILFNHLESVRAILITAQFHMTEESQLSLDYMFHFHSTIWRKSSPYTLRALSLVDARFCTWYCAWHICGFHWVAAKWMGRWMAGWMDSSAANFHVFISVRNCRLPMVLISLWVPHNWLAHCFSFNHGQTVYSWKTDSAKLSFCPASMAQ